jgi:hypothetical protein
MSFTLHEISAALFVRSLGNMPAWLDKAAAEGCEDELLDARLAPDMRPLTAQFQMASDLAKNAIGRLVGVDAPAMADDEANFAELKERIRRTIAYIESVPAAAIDAG